MPDAKPSVAAGSIRGVDPSALVFVEVAAFGGGRYRRAVARSSSRLLASGGAAGPRQLRRFGRQAAARGRQYLDDANLEAGETEGAGHAGPAAIPARLAFRGVLQGLLHGPVRLANVPPRGQPAQS